MTKTFSIGVEGSLSYLRKFQRGGEGGGAISSLQKWKIQGGGGGVLSEIPSVVGVSILSGTTQWVNKTMYERN